PRVRDLVYPAVYLLSFALLFGCAYFYLEGDATARRLPTTAPEPIVGTDLTCSRTGTHRPVPTFGDDRAPRIADLTLPVTA
ncbi:MAG TPA: hypothetical protein VNC22_09145, partial [Sporichthya sp.]|nr:hypothetical protein [Sporichthya sp.]